MSARSTRRWKNTRAATGDSAASTKADSRASAMDEPRRQPTVPADMAIAPRSVPSAPVPCNGMPRCS